MSTDNNCWTTGVWTHTHLFLSSESTTTGLFFWGGGDSRVWRQADTFSLVVTLVKVSVTDWVASDCLVTPAAEESWRWNLNLFGRTSQAVVVLVKPEAVDVNVGEMGEHVLYGGEGKKARWRNGKDLIPRMGVFVCMFITPRYGLMSF